MYVIYVFKYDSWNTNKNFIDFFISYFSLDSYMATWLHVPQDKYITFYTGMFEWLAEHAL